MRQLDLSLKKIKNEKIFQNNYIIFSVNVNIARFVYNVIAGTFHNAFIICIFRVILAPLKQQLHALKLNLIFATLAHFMQHGLLAFILLIRIAIVLV